MSEPILPNTDRPVLVAMSGGVDSAVMAAILARAGYDCIGVTMRLVPEPEEKSPFEPCCGLQASEDAKRVCDKVGIPHQVLHAVERFDRDIIANFVEEYHAGRTPNPCVRCNRMIKFGALYQHADKLGCGYIAMGHYARIEARGDRLALRRGVYGPKDQSYVLAPLTQPQLRRAIFPLGAMTKEQVREYAWGLDFGMATKPESQEICFVHDNNYRNLVEKRAGKMPPGPIVTTRGEVLGEHDGLMNYTPGQRRGLGIAADKPLYVVRLDVQRNAVVVGHDDEALSPGFTTLNIAWGGLPATTAPFDCLVQLRSRHTPVPATVHPQKGGAEVRLHEPQRAVTPGQWAVFYDEEDFVLGAAIVRRFEMARPAAASKPDPAG